MELFLHGKDHYFLQYTSSSYYYSITHPSSSQSHPPTPGVCFFSDIVSETWTSERELKPKLAYTNSRTHQQRHPEQILIHYKTHSNLEPRSVQMGSGDCFRSLINLRKVKAGRSKKAKVHSTSEKTNGSKTQDEGESSSHVIANDAPERNFDAPRISADQHLAARQIQTAFRAYRAGKSADRMKGDVRFNVLIQGNDTEKQTSTALSYIHSWSNIQAQIRARRYHMVTEGRIKQKKLESQLKLEAKLHELEAEWCGGSETMEEILSRIQQREEAAIKRERAMAYAFSHQWRANATQFLGQAYYSLGKEDWGWSWKERWIAARPWEIRVHSHPSKLKRGHAHSRQASTSDIKIPIPSTFALSNGDGNSKIKKLPNPIVEEIAREASPKHVLSSSP